MNAIKNLVARLFGHRDDSKHHRRNSGRTRTVKSALTGCEIPATLKGYPCARRPVGYKHGPSEKAIARRRKRMKDVTP